LHGSAFVLLKTDLFVRPFLPRRRAKCRLAPTRAQTPKTQIPTPVSQSPETKNMTKKFRQGWGPWVRYRAELGLSPSDEVDLHFGKRDPKVMTFRQAMDGITAIVVASLKEARRNGRPYVVFIHGSSTSRRGKTTARSQVRGFMRSKEATPLIDRGECIQHVTVFIAKLKPAVERNRPTTRDPGGA
jgi:hypothetical protein